MAVKLRRRLALEIGVVLAVNVFVLYLIWVAWFSHPASKHMRMPPEEVARQVVAAPSVPLSLAAQVDAKHPSK